MARSFTFKMTRTDLTTRSLQMAKTKLPCSTSYNPQKGSVTINMSTASQRVIQSALVYSLKTRARFAKEIRWSR